MGKFLVVIAILAISLLFFQNCGDVKLKVPQAIEIPTPKNDPEVLQQASLTLEQAPTVTESQCDEYQAVPHSYVQGEEPIIYYLCDKLLSNPSPTRKLSATVAENMRMDFSHVMPFSKVLQQRFSANDDVVKNLKIVWWKNTTASPDLKMNPADPLARFVDVGRHGEKYSYSFQFQNGKDAGLVHTIDINVMKVAEPRSAVGISCPGFQSTVGYDQYAQGGYFTGSHGFIDGKTAVVMKIRIAPTAAGTIRIQTPYQEPWTYITNISTSPCDFQTNQATLYHGGYIEFRFYTGEYPMSQGQPMSALDSFGGAYARLESNKDYYLNMYSPDCSTAITMDGKQRNCWMEIQLMYPFNRPDGASALVDEFRGVYSVNGTALAPLVPCYTCGGIQSAR